MTDHKRRSALFKRACLAEIEALKPGNVHIFADGHGMTVQDFIRSAEAASEPVAQPGASVGKRILDAVNATWDAVSCNTNLGIVLLAAPMLLAAEQVNGRGLRAALLTVLEQLTLEDADLAFQAILRASPAGLGDAEKNDVREPARASLLEAMRTAQQRDMIARQYVTAYADIFAAAKLYDEMSIKWERSAWATTAVYLHFLSNFEDSHIVRKFGQSLANATRQQAEAHYRHFIGLENPKTYMKVLLDFDAELKQRGVNPGTSADMTVATILCSLLQQG